MEGGFYNAAHTACGSHISSVLASIIGFPLLGPLMLYGSSRRVLFIAAAFRWRRKLPVQMKASSECSNLSVPKALYEARNNV